MDKKEVCVNKVVISSKNSPLIKNSLKSKRGFQSIPIPEYLHRHLEKYFKTKASCSAMWRRIQNAINLSTGGAKDSL